MAHNVFDQHDGAFHDHTEVERAKRQQIGGNVHQVQTNGRKQQSKRNGRGDDESATNITQKQKQNDRYQDHSFGQIVQHGVGCVVNQKTAIEEGDDLDSLRQDVIVKFFYFFMDGRERLLAGCAFSQQHDARDYIVVIDDLPILTVKGSRKLTEANLRTLRNHGNVLDPQRRAILGYDDGAFDVLGTVDQSHRPHVDLLQTLLNEAAAGVDVVAGELLLDLG